MIVLSLKGYVFFLVISAHFSGQLLDILRLDIADTKSMLISDMSFIVVFYTSNKIMINYLQVIDWKCYKVTLIDKKVLLGRRVLNTALADGCRMFGFYKTGSRYPVHEKAG